MRVGVVLILYLAVGTSIYLQMPVLDLQPLGPIELTPVGTVFAVASMVLAVGWGLLSPEGAPCG